MPLVSPSRSSLLRSLDVSSSSLLLYELSSSSLSRAALSSSSFARFADERAARSHLARSEGTPDGTWVGHMAQPCQENVVAIGVVADEHQSMSEHECRRGDTTRVAQRSSHRGMANARTRVRTRKCNPLHACVSACVDESERPSTQQHTCLAHMQAHMYATHTCEEGLEGSE